MSETPETTTEALQAELEALRTKNVELLAELKAAKAGAKDAQAALEAAHGERDAALADVRALRLDAPVARALEEVALDGELFHAMFGRHYSFDLDEHGAIVILDKDGNRAMVTEPETVTTGGNKRSERQAEQRTPGKERAARFDADDIKLLADACPDADKLKTVTIGTRASGGGALGSRPGGSVPTTGGSDKATEAAAPSPFGLR